MQRVFQISLFQRDYSPCRIFKRRSFQLSHVSEKHLNTQMSFSTTACSKQGRQLIRIQDALSSWVLKICKDKNPGSSLGNQFNYLCGETFFPLVRISRISSSSALSCLSLPSHYYCKVNTLQQSSTSCDCTGTALRMFDL